MGIYYIAYDDDGATKIIAAALFLYPIPLAKLNNFSITAGNLIPGQQVYTSLTREELLNYLDLAIKGSILVKGRTIRLEAEVEHNYFSEHPFPDTWHTKLNLQIMGRTNSISVAETAEIETALRNSNPPFDGLMDLRSWLVLSNQRVNSIESTLNIQIDPPVDMNFDQSSLQDNKFHLVLNAHPKLDISEFGVSIRAFPGKGLESRKQVGTLIKWSRIKKGIRLGQLKLNLSSADSVLVMITLGRHTIRRQWFNDPNKALNTRYIATQCFDKELKYLRQTLLESTDSERFEKAVASLLYLLGFSAAIQVETQAPDILVSTPTGKLAVIECTIKISDFQSKVGKLVDRRNALLESLTVGNVHRIDAFLVCRLPRARIAADEPLLIKHQVTLLSAEDLANALNSLRTPTSPDELLDRAAAQLEQARHPIRQ